MTEMITDNQRIGDVEEGFQFKRKEREKPCK